MSKLAPHTEGTSSRDTTPNSSTAGAAKEESTATHTAPQVAKLEGDKSSSKSSPSSTPAPLPTKSKEKEKEKEGWYPGKMIGLKPKDSSSGGGSKPSPSFVRNNFPIAGKPPVKTVGNVIIKILGVKYMSATRPSFEVWLGTQVETFKFMGLEQDGSSTEEFEGFFSLGDLTSDIVVLVKEEYKVGGGGSRKEGGEEDFVGRVVIPLPSYLTLQGRRPPHKEWMAVYPLANSKVKTSVSMQERRPSGLYSLSMFGCNFVIHFVWEYRTQWMIIKVASTSYQPLECRNLNNPLDFCKYLNIQLFLYEFPISIYADLYANN